VQQQAQKSNPNAGDYNPKNPLAGYPAGSVIVENPSNMGAGQVPTDINNNPTEYSAYGYAFNAGTPMPADAAHAKAAAAANTQTTSTAPAATPPDDVLTAGLGMFFSQYLAPMMSQINSQNNQLIGQWGNTMNQALNQPLPPGIKAIMQPWVGQNQQMLGMINTSAADQVLGQIPFNTLMNSLQMAGQGEQAIAAGLPTAAADQLLAQGSSSGLASLVNQPGIAGTQAGQALTALLNTPSLLQSLTGGKSSTPGTSGTQQSPASLSPVQSPIVVQQAAAPAASAAANPSSDYASQLALGLLNNTAMQNTAANANATAGAGYNPPAPLG
jgi:hypothetical protein